MESRLKFYRTFLVFEREDGGYGIGKEPSGYVKIEVREGKGKLWAVVQNLRQDGNINNYKLFLIKNKDFIPVLAGVIPLNKNRGELKWEFDASNVGDTGNSILDFETAVVLAEPREGNNQQIICPLAAYKTKNIKWREGTKHHLYASKKDTPSYPREEEAISTDVFSKYTGYYESKYMPVEDDPMLNIPQIIDDRILKESHVPETGEDIEVEKQVIESEVKIAEDSREEVEEKFMGEQAEECAKEHLEEPVDETIDEIDTDERTESVNISHDSCKEKAEECMRGLGNLSGLSKDEQALNPCSLCYMNKNNMSNLRNKDGSIDIEKLKDYFNKYFERHEPFNIKRRDYKWWKVINPVFLNNILYHCNIRTPLMLNPALMMSYYRYKHLIVGFFTDLSRRREYIVAGIPALYNIDERPFGEMCRWVQLDSGRLRYGAFGYWLVYIDPRTGKFLKFR